MNTNSGWRRARALVREDPSLLASALRRRVVSSTVRLTRGRTVRRVAWFVANHDPRALDHILRQLEGHLQQRGVVWIEASGDDPIDFRNVQRDCADRSESAHVPRVAIVTGLTLQDASFDRASVRSRDVVMIESETSDSSLNRKAIEAALGTEETLSHGRRDALDDALPKGRLIASDHGDAAEVTQQLLKSVGISIDAEDLSTVVEPPPWTLRGILAADAVNGILQPGQRSEIHEAIRKATSEPPARPPMAIYGTPHGRRSQTPLVEHLRLHVGLEEAGSSSIRRTLRAHTDLLGQLGITYVDQREVAALEHFRAWSATRATGAAEFRTFATNLTNLIARRQREMEDQSGDRPSTVLLSDWHLLGERVDGPFLDRPLRPRAERAIFEILDVLQPERCSVVLVALQPDHLVEEIYLSQIASGGSHSVDSLVSAAVADLSTLSTRRLMERLAACVGVETVEMVAVDGATSADIYPVLLEQDTTPIEAGVTWQSEPLGAEALSEMIRLNLEQPNARSRKRAHARIRKQLRSSEDTGSVLTPDQRKIILNAYSSEEHIPLTPREEASPLNSHVGLSSAVAMGSKQGSSSERP